MNQLLAKSANFIRIEFWAFSALFAFSLFFFIADGVEDVSHIYTPNRGKFEEADINFNYYRHYFFPQIVRNFFFFFAFLFLNFYVLPKLIIRDSLTFQIIILISVFLLAGLVIGITDTYLKAYLFAEFQTEEEVFDQIFQKSYLYATWLMLMLGFYTVIKYLGIYLLSNVKAIHSKYRFITPNGIVAFVFWMIGLFLLLMARGDDEEITGAWGVIIPTAIGIYWYSFYNLIPNSLSKKRAFLVYLGKILLLLALIFFPTSLLLLLLTNNEDISFGISLFNIAFQAFVTAPFSWLLYKKHLRGNEEMQVLKKELGQTSANFDFLRSQINPHFLFNALNTIYGTALQEKAERTGEGIQRLGDMMRFMLQENLQDTISLNREIDYLNNYISLQRLRTDTHPNVRIQAEIDQPNMLLQIAPMLLIPFVENAFKHGISFREPSHIKVGLEVKNGTLFFDVYNSIHEKTDSDPEKDKTGIGLGNVKQRLKLLYPAKHELLIRETGREFFAHLTIVLTDQNN